MITLYGFQMGYKAYVLLSQSRQVGFCPIICKDELLKSHGRDVRLRPYVAD